LEEEEEEEEVDLRVWNRGSVFRRRMFFHNTFFINLTHWSFLLAVAPSVVGVSWFFQLRRRLISG